jgi:hypothetical protein
LDHGHLSREPALAGHPEPMTGLYASPPIMLAGSPATRSWHHAPHGDLPGEGVALAKVGESRDMVESRLGPPVHPGRHGRAVYETSPMLVLT